MKKAIKPKICKECGQEFMPYNYLQSACSLKCARVIANKKLEENAKKEARWKKREFYYNDRAWLTDKLQKKVQSIARKIDFNLPCLATNKRGQMHGGHIFTKGGHPQMRYNLHNIHRQVSQSNRHQSDDGLMQEGL